MGTRTVAVTYVRAAVETARRRGLDVDHALASAGIPHMLLSDNRARCTPEQVTTLVRELWRISDDELFGMGRTAVPRGTFRLISYALITSPDLHTVWQRIGDFGPALPALPRCDLSVADGVARLQADMSGIDDPTRLLTDFMLALAHRFTGWLVGQRIRLNVVEFPYPAPADIDEYDLIYGAPLRFDAATPALEFDSRLLTLPIVRSERELDEYLKHSPADLLARRDYGSTLADQARRILERGLRGEWPTSDDVAARLSISAQHLRRRLRDEGTSLGEIKDDLLRDAAVTGLTRGETVDDLSARLGFSEPSAFRRAFKRWTGTTPAAYQPTRRSASP